jgi:hypothetical protein
MNYFLIPQPPIPQQDELLIVGPEILLAEYRNAFKQRIRASSRNRPSLSISIDNSSQAYRGHLALREPNTLRTELKDSTT